MYIPKSTFKRILKEAGACRVSNDAVDTFHREMNRMAFGIAERAVRLAKHAKRKTVEGSDVKLANHH
jgi:histone H3/H4